MQGLDVVLLEKVKAEQERKRAEQLEQQQLRQKGEQKASGKDKVCVLLVFLRDSQNDRSGRVGAH
jgi:hypothetical protein